MSIRVDWIDDIQQEDSFFVQTNLENLNNQIQLKLDEITELLYPNNPVIIVEPTGTVQLTRLGNRDIKIIKLTANTIWAQINNGNDSISSLEYFSMVVNKMCPILGVKNFLRTGIRKQYVHYFDSQKERKDFFCEIVNFKDFIEIGIIKNTSIDEFTASIQILPTTKDNVQFGIVLDADIFIEDKGGEKLSFSNINAYLDKIYGNFNQLMKKTFS